jgi:hypothetical protein
VADGKTCEKGYLVYRELVVSSGFEDYLADNLERDFREE